MPKAPGRVFFLSDRDIYDGLYSSKRQVTPNMLREFLLERGIFMSDSLDREGFISYISNLNLDYHDVQFLIEQLSSAGKKEKVRMVDLDCQLTKQELRDVLQEVRDERSSKHDEVYQTNITGDESKVSVNVEYEDVDLSRTRLRQKKEREANIETEITESGGIRIRFPDNIRSENIVDVIKEKIKKRKSYSVNETVIDLSSITLFSLRSQFFMEIIKNMSKDMNLHDVKKVAVESRLFGDLNGDKEVETDADIHAKGLVHKALLSGNSILTSQTCRDLMDKGFYIYRLNWQMAELGFDNAILEYEAFFSDAPNCTKFSCQVAGMYPTKGEGFTITRRPIPNSEVSRYFGNLEKAAAQAYAKVLTLNINPDEEK